MRSGESKDIVWRVTPVRAGSYTVHYEVAAGLYGKAKAVTADGGPVKGEFAVTIKSKPPRDLRQGHQAGHDPLPGVLAVGAAPASTLKLS